MSKNRGVLCIFFCLALPLLAKEGDPWNDNSPDSKPFFSSEERPIVTVPLHGNNSFGSYFVNLYFGTPAQQRSMILYLYGPDTLLRCKECGSNCGSNHPHELYDPKESQTDREMVFGEQYGDFTCPNTGSNQCALNPFSPDASRLLYLNCSNYTSLG